ncbi:twin-arginine translocase subunit TatC [Sphingomonas sp.]|uniref:twin-arginine translocase subunit TatC n=1 Tax=Sphingomonas sp. TaxID=28214 RepID=UPI001DF46DEB|nr:twin-arginine translocase subunit TatC [Sphingomonas sp.]MBX9797065.1 twin-arginine translocase subunit TatC [Sphingomonas sp.]
MTDERDEIEASRAPLLDHLVELRRRLIYCVVAVLVAFFGCFFFARDILQILVHPLVAAGQKEIINTDVFGGFFVQVKVALFAGMMIGSPVIANQLWQFVAPGLYGREKRALLPFLFATPVLFSAGAAMAYFIAVPIALKFLLGFQGDLGGVEQRALPDVNNYLGFIMQFMFGFGVSFLLPILLMLLERAGIVTRRQLTGFRRYAIVLAFGIAALLTPPDIGSQLLLAIPLIILYELGIIGIWLTERRRKPAEAAAE